MKLKKAQFLLFLIPILCICGCPDNEQEEEYRITLIYGGYGSEPGQFNTPMGIVIRRVPEPLGDCLLIADYGNNRIQIFSPSLYQNRPDTIIVIEESLTDSTELLWPTSLTVTQSLLNDLSSPVSDNPLIYVTDSRNNRIVVYDLDGNLQNQWGSYGSDTGQFISPIGIDMDFEGNIFVVDSGSHRIQVFDTLGNFIRMWGKKGDSAGQFNGPIDIEVCFAGRDSDVFKYVAVSDHGNNRIQLFDRDGKFIRVITGVAGPTGLSYDGSGFNIISSKTGKGYKADDLEVFRSFIIPESVEPYGIYLDYDCPTISDIEKHRVAFYIPGWY